MECRKAHVDHEPFRSYESPFPNEKLREIRHISAVIQIIKSLNFMVKQRTILAINNNQAFFISQNKSLKINRFHVQPLRKALKATTKYFRLKITEISKCNLKGTTRPVDTI